MRRRGDGLRLRLCEPAGLRRGCPGVRPLAHDHVLRLPVRPWRFLLSEVDAFLEPGPGLSRSGGGPPGRGRPRALERVGRPRRRGSHAQPDARHGGELPDATRSHGLLRRSDLHRGRERRRGDRDGQLERGARTPGFHSPAVDGSERRHGRRLHRAGKRRLCRRRDRADLHRHCGRRRRRRRRRDGHARVRHLAAAVGDDGRQPGQRHGDARRRRSHGGGRAERERGGPDLGSGLARDLRPGRRDRGHGALRPERHGHGHPATRVDAGRRYAADDASGRRRRGAHLRLHRGRGRQRHRRGGHRGRQSVGHDPGRRRQCRPDARGGGGRRGPPGGRRPAGAAGGSGRRHPAGVDLRRGTETDLGLRHPGLGLVRGDERRQHRARGRCGGDVADLGAEVVSVGVSRANGDGELQPGSVVASRCGGHQGGGLHRSVGDERDAAAALRRGP